MDLNHVKGRRNAMGLSSKQVAEALGIPVTNYLNRERGKTKFSDEEKVKLAKLFGWTPEEMNTYLYDGKLPLDGQTKW